jgi:MtN3 and saliva related transmembrane protein
MNSADVVGYIATVVGTSMMVPQVVKIVRTKKAADLSLLMAILFAANCALWFLYGALQSARPIIIANGLAFMIGIYQIVLKVIYDLGGHCAGNEKSNSL